MQPDQQAYFERIDKWSYKLLLQELYRDCVLSSHDSISFIEHVKKLDVSVTNFPGLHIRDAINKRMAPYVKECFDALVKRRIAFRTSHSTQAIADAVSYHWDKHDILSIYYHHLFNTLRDVLALHGAFNLSKQEKEHGFELQEAE